MKKKMLFLGLVILLILAVFFWSLSGASVQHAPDEVKTIDVTPQS